MARTAVCPGCSAPLVIPDDWDQSEAKCPRCQTVILVSGSAGEPDFGDDLQPRSGGIPGKLLLVCGLLLILVIALGVVLGLTIMERRRLAEERPPEEQIARLKQEQTRNAELLAQLETQRKQVEQDLQQNKIDHDRIEKKMEEVRDLPRKAQEERERAREELERADGELKKATADLQEARKLRDASLADKQKAEALLAEQEARRKQNEETAQELVRLKLEKELAEKRAAAKEEDAARALKKIQDVQRLFNLFLKSPEAQRRKDAATALTKLRGPLLSSVAVHDLCAAVVHEKDAEVKEHLAVCFREVSPQLCGLVKKLLDNDSAKSYAVQTTALKELARLEEAGKNAAPAVHWYLDQALNDLEKRYPQAFSSSGKAERAMEALEAIAPEEPETAQLLCRALRMKITPDFNRAYLDYYKAVTTVLSVVYSKNAEARTEVVEAARTLQTSREPEVAKVAEKFLEGLDPPPGN